LEKNKKKLQICLLGTSLSHFLSFLGTIVKNVW
jgi:hypothetical protein